MLSLGAYISHLITKILAMRKGAMLATRYSLLATILCIAFTSCSYIEQYIKERESEGIIASVGDKHLYIEEIKNLVPEGTNSVDSVAIIDAYIRRWATNILIYDNAIRNVSNQNEINKMVNDYRRTLTIHYYKQEMVNEKVKVPTDAEATKFYNENQNLFLLEEPIIKGAVIKLPNNIKTDKIERDFKNINKNIEIIEKYALQYAIDYELFTDYWKPLSNVVDTETSNLKITKSGYYSEQDSIHLLLVNITEYINQGEIAPLEMVIEEARSTLYNQKKMEYLNNFGNDIYDYAIKHNQIKLRIEN